jgi:hypothetical protein
MAAEQIGCLQFPEVPAAGLVGQLGAAQGLQVEGARVLNGRRSWTTPIGQGISLFLKNQSLCAIQVSASRDAVAQLD